MNFCTECKSLYEKPGTCNCYATVAKPVQPQPVAPSVPYVPYTPVYPNTWPWWNQPTAPVITYGTVTGVDATTHPITSTTVCADSPWFKNISYT
jgi:hypothetical protein